MYKYILFDLDGTISDPKVGICTSVQQALSKMGIEEPDIDKLEPFIGPSLKTSFTEFYGMSEEDADKAIGYYRERYSTVGKFENELYSGMDGLLSDLKKKGRVLAIASGKPTPFVEDILNHFEIREYFDVVVGSELDGSRDAKEDIMREAIRQIFGEEEPDYDELVMIGDRKYDVEASFSIGIPCISVTYGYGTREELEEAGADKIVNTINGLRATLMPIMTSPAPARSAAPAQGSAANDGQSGENNGQNNGQRSTADLKAMRKDIGKQSFANMWGYLGPALMYWIGRTAITYLILTIVFNYIRDYFDAETGTIVPGYENTLYTIDYIIPRVAIVLVCLFLFKDMKWLIKKVKNTEKLKVFPTRDLSIASAGSVLLAIGCGAVSVITTAMMQANAAATAAASANDISSQLADVSGQVAGSAASAAPAFVYTPPILLGILFSGIIVPIVQEAIFVGICYTRAKRYMTAMPLVFSAIIFGFIHRNDVSGFSMMLLMGVSMFIYDISANLLISAGVFVLSNIALYLTVNTGFADVFNNNGRVAAAFVALGLAMIFVVYFMRKKEAKLAKEAQSQQD